MNAPQLEEFGDVYLRPTTKQQEVTANLEDPGYPHFQLNRNHLLMDR